MDCPTKGCGGKLHVTHSYKTPAGTTQRRECSTCLLVSTSVVVLLNVEPEEGEGARAVAARLMRGEEIKISLPGPAESTPGS